MLWFDVAERQAIGEALGEVIRRERLTCYACAVLTDHVHVLIRKHRLKGEEMSRAFKDAARERLRRAGCVSEDHPVFSADACDMYKSDPQAVRNCIQYIYDNFRKHHLPPVEYKYVVGYDGWPFHKTEGTRR